MLKTLCLALHLCSTFNGPARVIDGDTIIVENYHVRLMGVDAEESNEPNGPAAKSYLENLLHNQIVHCQWNGEKSYHRYVAVCRTAAGDIAAQLVYFGLALDCRRFSNGKYRHLEPNGIRTVLRQKPYC